MFAAGYWQIKERVIAVPASGTVVALVQSDNQRWAFVVSTANGAVGISTTTTVGALGNVPGILLGSSASFLVRYADYGGLAQAAWNVQSQGPALNVTVFEIRLLSEPPKDA